MNINLPFSRLGIVMGDPIYVPREAGAAELESYCKIVEAALNDVTAPIPPGPTRMNVSRMI